MQTNTKQEDILSTPDSTGAETKWNSNSTNFQKIDDTVFGLVHIPEEGYFLVIGANRITEAFPTAEEALQQLEKDMWNIIMKMCIIVVEASKAITEEEVNQKKYLSNCV